MVKPLKKGQATVEKYRSKPLKDRVPPPTPAKPQSVTCAVVRATFTTVKESHAYQFGQPPKNRSTPPCSLPIGSFLWAIFLVEGQFSPIFAHKEMLSLPSYLPSVSGPLLLNVTFDP